MVNSKKLLSLFLAVVMILSTFSVVAFAYTREGEIANGINYKYTVEKVDVVPETEAGSAEYVSDNIYAVSLWMKASMGVDLINTALHYNKALFAPIMLFDGDVTYPVGAGLDQDTYYSDMGEGALYAYSLGDYLNNTGMYKADGSKATTKALAKCIGLGNSNSAGVGVEAELVSPDHPLYNKWGAGLSADTGVMRVMLDVVGNAKTAYLNTISGINYSTDWNKMFTFYFERLPGVTEEDVNGAEFGIFTDDCFTVDGNFDGTGSGYFVSATQYSGVRPATNITSNAVIEKEATPLTVAHLKDQIRFDTKADGSYKKTFDYRVIASIDLGDATEADLKMAGFVFNKGEGATIDAAKALEDVKAKSADANATTNYSMTTKAYISTSFKDNGTAVPYAMSCVVNNVPDAEKGNTIATVGYVVYELNGETCYALYDVEAVQFSGLYDTYYSQQFGA